LLRRFSLELVIFLVIVTINYLPGRCRGITVRIIVLILVILVIFLVLVEIISIVFLVILIHVRAVCCVEPF
jgi:hypothetical protein